MRTRLLGICAAFLFVVGAATAQQPDQDPIGQSFLCPELVIQHQEADWPERGAKRVLQDGNPAGAVEIQPNCMEAVPG